MINKYNENIKSELRLIAVGILISVISAGVAYDNQHLGVMWAMIVCAIFLLYVVLAYCIDAW